MKTSKIWSSNLTPLVPVDSLASKVAKPGPGYEMDLNISQRHWKNPPKMCLVPVGMPDLTGSKFGRFVVIGLYPKRRHHGHRLWVVRCACGNYETRKFGSVDNSRNHEDCCLVCRQLLGLKKSQRYREIGRSVDLL